MGPRAANPLCIDRERIFERGFGVVERLVDGDTLEALRAAYDDIIERRVPARGDRQLGGIIRQVKHAWMDHPVFAANAALDRGLELARALFDRDDLARVYDMLIDKPPGATEPTPWHQDVGYFGRPVAPPGVRSDYPDVQIWLALDPVDGQNGCMNFIPTPYGAPSREHAVVSGDPDDEGRLIALTEPVDAAAAVACPLPAGGCTLHFLGTPHYTGGNGSARPRRAYIFNVGLRTFAAGAAAALEKTWGRSARL
jgi:ectoine hydroxylase-related dioxygenase (phytanoyl-CoA dioxygenase family)